VCVPVPTGELTQRVLPLKKRDREALAGWLAGWLEGSPDAIGRALAYRISGGIQWRR